MQLRVVVPITLIIMIEFIREALAHRTADRSYMEAVIEGSVARLRPKLMTVATTVFGLLPIMFSSGSGMDITQPIATPTLGGMISSTIYVLFTRVAPVGRWCDPERPLVNAGRCGTRRTPTNDGSRN